LSPLSRSREKGTERKEEATPEIGRKGKKRKKKRGKKEIIPPRKGGRHRKKTSAVCPRDGDKGYEKKGDRCALRGKGGGVVKLMKEKGRERCHCAPEKIILCQGTAMLEGAGVAKKTLEKRYYFGKERSQYHL